MANKRFNGLAGKQGGKADYFEQGDGDPGTAMPMKTANWPGLPGPKGPDRSNGVSQVGHCGPFHHKSIMSPEMNPGDYVDAQQSPAVIGGGVGTMMQPPAPMTPQQADVQRIQQDAYFQNRGSLGTPGNPMPMPMGGLGSLPTRRGRNRGY